MDPKRPPGPEKKTRARRARLADRDIDFTDMLAAHGVAKRRPANDVAIGCRPAGHAVARVAGEICAPGTVRRWYIYLVRVKTSVTLPADLLATIDQVSTNRSAFVERAARAYLARLDKASREARDIEIINRNAERLNAEALDVLGYQRIP